MKILILANPTSAATDYYRTIGPFLRLAQINLDYSIEIQYPQNCKWHHMQAADVVVFQRPNGEDVLNFIAEAKRMQKRILIDIDDLLHGVNEANPAAKHFNNEQVQESINNALRLGDHLIVSTPALASFYANIFQGDITVIPNCPNLDSTPYASVRPQHEPIRVLWRGSTTHLQDLYTIENVWKILGQNPAFSLMFIGVEKFMLPWFSGKAAFVPWQTLFALFDGMAQAAPDWGLYPLTNDPFNQAKSNIFAMEMLIAGAPVLAPDNMPEWQHPGVLNYKNQLHLQILISDIASGKIDKQKHVEEGRNWINANRNLDEWNTLRHQIIQTLCK